jgi:hypothetical protein
MTDIEWMGHLVALFGWMIPPELKASRSGSALGLGAKHWSKARRWQRQIDASRLQSARGWAWRSVRAMRRATLASNGLASVRRWPPVDSVQAHHVAT